mmetsp:Transcript_19341/g.40611  ORF Transcript_19341/g.40611 Transcript_19341/m.40611 type:complete len:221 (+) Transcript_19341:254-916(+)
MTPSRAISRISIWTAWPRWPRRFRRGSTSSTGRLRRLAQCTLRAMGMRRRRREPRRMPKCMEIQILLLCRNSIPRLPNPFGPMPPCRIFKSRPLGNSSWPTEGRSPSTRSSPKTSTDCSGKRTPRNRRGSWETKASSRRIPPSRGPTTAPSPSEFIPETTAETSSTTPATPRAPGTKTSWSPYGRLLPSRPIKRRSCSICTGRKIDRGHWTTCSNIGFPP